MHAQDYCIAQNFNGQIFCDFCEFQDDYENYYEPFLTAALGTGFHSSKSKNPKI